MLGAEAEIAELLGGRNKCRRATRELRALGFDGREPQLGLAVDDDLVRRMQGLAKAYQDALKEVHDGQVGRLMGAG